MDAKHLRAPLSQNLTKHQASRSSSHRFISSAFICASTHTICIGHRTVSKLSIPSFRAPPTGADKAAAHESHVQGLGTQALCCDMAESNPIQPCPTPPNRPAMVTIVCPPNTFNPFQSMFHGSIHVKFNTYSNVFNTCLLHPNPACSSQKSSPRPRKASRRHST